MVLQPTLQNANFNLDVSGIAGFFGGEESFAAMSSMHLMRHRRWLGWYNSPGSYYIAKKYGTLAKSRLWNGLFPGPPVAPAKMLELDSQEGPRYMGVHSGTRIDKTGHLAYLLARYCEQINYTEGQSDTPSVRVPLPFSPPQSPTPDSESIQLSKSAIPTRTDKKKSCSVTIVDLGHFKKWVGYPNVPAASLLPFEPLGLVVTLATVVGTVLSALWGDWFSFAMIILGAISSGVSSYVLGSGELQLKFPDPSTNSPPGDGILVSSRHDIVVLKGSENSVSNIIRGRYHLEYASAPKYRNIGVSSVILTMQFLLQLFLVPQGQLIGQIMFLGTFIISWIFNAYLASVDRETLQTEVLFKTLGIPPKHKFTKLYFEKWSTAAAFAAFYVHPDTLKDLLPNDTASWAVWKDFIIQAHSKCRDPTYLLQSDESQAKMKNLTPEEQKFVHEFIEYAGEAFQDAQKILHKDSEKISCEKNVYNPDTYQSTTFSKIRMGLLGRKRAGAASDFQIGANNA
ncbi:hypothetical protein BDN70DRAFT_669630 [Pholiota conissans]|uniref:Uncharacterized protein n=1 Tax=Pholiota conissans TaxID=109636 RepID=A0A9P5Z1Z1_9AGAR|nr:hypothetical protein BDN70DRAFT_669630 [Pholiota conissans]